MPKVFVSGCFDVLHSGHVAFLEEAASYGDLYVSLGSDATIMELKNRKPVYNQKERQYMLEALGCVHQVMIGPGKGSLDFAPLLDLVKPDIFFVNADGSSEEKRAFIESRGIRYVTSSRLPHEGLPVRSTTSIREELGRAGSAPAEGGYAIGQKDSRPWGSWEVLSVMPTSVVKKLMVLPGKRTSLQRHFHRAECWVVVEGVATVSKDGEDFQLEPGNVAFLPENCLHRLENKTQSPVHLIEIQLGDSLREDDIERITDDYGRA